MSLVSEGQSCSRQVVEAGGGDSSPHEGRPGEGGLEGRGRRKEPGPHSSSFVGVKKRWLPGSGVSRAASVIPPRNRPDFG